MVVGLREALKMLDLGGWEVKKSCWNHQERPWMSRVVRKCLKGPHKEVLEVRGVLGAEFPKTAPDCAVGTERIPKDIKMFLECTKKNSGIGSWKVQEVGEILEVPEFPWNAPDLGCW